jgi:riboflavin transporter FmnP
METLQAGKQRVNGTDIRTVAQVGVLGGIAFLLMTIEIPLWFAPGFYRLDLSELPVLVGAFAMGPLAGVLIELVKVVLYFFIHGSSTAGVGDMANFMMGCALVVPAAALYKNHKTKKRAVAGLVCGTVAMAAVSSLLNAFLLLPLYAAAFHMPLAQIVQMGTQVNPAVTNLFTFVLFAVVPFNLFKGVVVSVLTMLLYKKVSPILHGKLH